MVLRPTLKKSIIARKLVTANRSCVIIYVTKARAEGVVEPVKIFF